MLKVLKKILLLAMLITNLIKQLAVGLTIFLYNRILGNKWIAVVCIGIVGLLFILGAVMFAPSNNLATAKADPVIINMPEETSGKLISGKTTIIDNQKMEDMEKLMAQSSECGTVDNIENNLKEAYAVSFQATELKQTTGFRAEPFSPPFGLGSDMGDIGAPMIGPDSKGGPNAAELAKQKAEERREEIRSSLGSDVVIKGIVVDANKKNPMAVIEIYGPGDTTSVRTVSPGEMISLRGCMAKIAAISDDKITLSSEDVKFDKYLPSYADEEDIIPTANINNNSTGKVQADNLMPPPTPAGNQTATPPAAKGNDSSIGNAKKKIDEIDKLLDSF